MTNSNYSESTTISHEPEEGDIYRDFGSTNLNYIVSADDDFISFVTKRKGNKGYFYTFGYCRKGDLHFDNFNDFYIYLGKAKNPITSIFEVE